MKKLLSIILLGCLLVSLIGCNSAESSNNSATDEQTSTVSESQSTEEEIDTRLTKEIIMEYVDENHSDLWVYEEDKYTDDLSLYIPAEKIENIDDVAYLSPSTYWSVFFFPNIVWDDEANSLIFDPYITYSNAWFLSNLNMYDEIQIATDSSHMKLVLDYANANYEVDYSESYGSVYMIEEDIDDLKQLLEMLDNNPSVRLNPVNADETIEFYLTDTMIMQFKEALTLYFELHELIR